jgi:hypothetical protein
VDVDAAGEVEAPLARGGHLSDEADPTGFPAREPPQVAEVEPPVVAGQAAADRLLVERDGGDEIGRQRVDRTHGVHDLHLEVPDARADDLDVGQGSHVGRPGPVVPAAREDYDVVAGCGEGSGEVAADESRPARDRKTHAPSLRHPF